MKRRPPHQPAGPVGGPLAQLAGPPRRPVAAQHRPEPGEGGGQQHDRGQPGRDPGAAGVALEGDQGQGEHGQGELDEGVPHPRHEHGQGAAGAREPEGVEHGVGQADADAGAPGDGVGDRRARQGHRHRLGPAQPGRDRHPQRPVGDQVPGGDQGNGEELEPGHLGDLGPDAVDVDPPQQEGEDRHGQQQRAQQLEP
jgi:hypothetical protein